MTPATRASRAFVPALLALLLLPQLAPAQPLRRRPRLDGEGARAERVLSLLGPEHLLREAWRVTKGHVYRRDLADWDALLARHLPRAADARSPEQVYAAVNEMLGELGVSHLVLVGRGVWERELAQEFDGRPRARAGFELVELEGRLFVDGLVEGGPGERAGLLEGDEVVAIEDVAARESPRLEGAGHDPGLPGPPGYSLRVASGERLSLVVRRRADEAPRAVVLEPFAITLAQASRNSARVVSVEGSAGPVQVGVLHLWHVIRREMLELTREALRGPLAGADALVLDVRGRGGSAQVVQGLLRLFGGRRRAWNKPVVCLIDGGTRSAKEILAWHWRERDLGPLVGATTQGACLGCGFFELSDGSILALPLVDVRRLTGGEQLERVGVEPTVPVASALALTRAPPATPARRRASPGSRRARGTRPSRLRAPARLPRAPSRAGRPCSAACRCGSPR